MRKRPAESASVQQSKSLKLSPEPIRITDGLTIVYNADQGFVCDKDQLRLYLNTKKANAGEWLDEFQCVKRHPQQLPIQYAFLVMFKSRVVDSAVLFEIQRHLHPSTDCQACGQELNNDRRINEQEAFKLSKWHGRDDFIPFVHGAHAECLERPPSTHLPFAAILFCPQHDMSSQKCGHLSSHVEFCPICTINIVQFCKHCQIPRCEACTKQYCPSCAKEEKKEPEKKKKNPLPFDETFLSFNSTMEDAMQHHPKSAFVLYSPTASLTDWYNKAMCKLDNPRVEVAYAMDKESSNPFLWVKGGRSYQQRKGAKAKQDRDWTFAEIIRQHLAAEKEQRLVHRDWTGQHKLKKVPIESTDPRMDMADGKHSKIIATSRFEQGEFMLLYSGQIGKDCDFDMEDEKIYDYVYGTGEVVDGHDVYISAHHAFGNHSKFFNDYHVDSKVPLSAQDEKKRINCVPTLFKVNGVPFIAFSAKKIIQPNEEILIQYSNDEGRPEDDRFDKTKPASRKINCPSCNRPITNMWLNKHIASKHKPVPEPQPVAAPPPQPLAPPPPPPQPQQLPRAERHVHFADADDDDWTREEEQEMQMEADLEYLDGLYDVETGVRKRFPCNLCSTSFDSKSALTIHQRIHTGERPHACQYCKRAFTQKNNKDRHEEICKVAKVAQAMLAIGSSGLVSPFV